MSFILKNKIINKNINWYLYIFQIFRISNDNKLHRWNLYGDNKIMNCSERMKICHSLNYYDYSKDIN